ncbi:hypothetical protein SDC9_89190 [bioreactor metagenome]|uniref:Uncharacterized protein n=1 Tax=bioreactor metagenome TaxID=1076179 RepID=A0A644ZNP6_9ZZZZ
MLGIKAGCQDLDQDQSCQADGVGDQGFAGSEDVLGRECTVKKQGCDQGDGQDGQPDGGRGGQQQGEAQSPVEQAGVFRMVAAGMATRQ